MNFSVAIVLYIILFLVILSVSWRFGMRPFSAVTLAALLSLIFLIILIPPTQLDKFTNDMVDGCDSESCNGVAMGLICLIYIITLVLIVWYVLSKSYDDIDVFLTV